VPGSKVSVKYAKICGLLKEFRRTAKLTQATVARRLGKPQSYVSKVESGERRIDLVELVEILEALKVDGLEFWDRVTRL
jgi:transcriptional regulator with XRE-family HTH domain